MEGGRAESERGMIPRAVEQIFSNIDENKKKGWEFEVTASFIEVSAKLTYSLSTF
jgi:kinesin family protein C1